MPRVPTSLRPKPSQCGILASVPSLKKKGGVAWLRIQKSRGATIRFNPWIGCAKVSPGCENCYAWMDMDIRRHRVKWGVNGTRSVTSDAYWRKPIQWNRKAALEHASRIGPTPRPRVFCASLADWLEDRPDLIEPRGRLLTLIANTPYLDWLLLTKRPEGWCDRLHEVVRYTHDGGDELASRWLDDEPPANVWVGTTAENQEYADKRISELVKIPAAVRFVSYEPALGPISFARWFDPNHITCMDVCDDQRYVMHGCGEYEEARSDRELLPLCSHCGLVAQFYADDIELHWIIAGGESGSNRRPCEVEWFADVAQQCKDARVSYFMKQDSGPRPGMQGRIPDDLWAIKEFPTTPSAVEHP